MQYDYKIIWTGEDNQTLSLGGLSFISGRPKYFTENSLPLKIKDIKNLQGVQVSNGPFIDPVDANDNVDLSKALTGGVGIVWKGERSFKNVMVGTKRASLEKNVPNFDFTRDEAEYIVKSYSGVVKV